LFEVHFLQDLDTERLVGSEPLQAAALLFQLLQTLRIEQLHASVLRLPAVDDLFAVAVLAGKIRVLSSPSRLK
jgi:hypothetical protein